MRSAPLLHLVYRWFRNLALRPAGLLMLALAGVVASALLLGTVSASGSDTTLQVTLTPPATSPTAGGAPFSVGVRVDNTSADTASGQPTTVTIGLPASGAVSLDSGPANCTQSGTSVVCSRDSIGAGGEDTFSLSLAADHTVSSPFHVTGTAADDTFGSNQDDITVGVVTSADLGFSSDVATPSAPAGSGVPAGDAVAGGAVQYVLTVHNGGPSDNAGFTAQDVLPHGASVPTAPAGCSVAAASGSHGDTVSCPVAGLAAGSDKVITISANIASNELDSATNGWSDSASFSANSTTDPTSGDTASDPLTLVTRADLALSESVVAPNATAYGVSDSSTVVAGDSHAYHYVVTVTNGGPSDNAGGFKVTDTLPVGAVFQNSGSYSTCGTSDVPPAQQTVTCDVNTATGLASGDHVDVPIYAKTASSVADTAGNATFKDSAKVDSLGTVDPTTPTDASNNDTSNAPLKVAARWNLQVSSMASSAQVLNAYDPNDPSKTPKNTTLFTFKFKNLGPSDAPNVTVSLPDGPPGSTLPYFVLDDRCRVITGTTCSNFSTGDVGTVQADPTGNTAVTVLVHAHANTALGFTPPTPRTTGFFTPTNSALVGPSAVGTTAGDWDTSDNIKPVLSNVRINTVSAPVTDLRSLPSDINDVLSWQAPATNSGGVPIDSSKPYQITVTRPSGTPLPNSCTPLPLSTTQCTIDVTTATAALPCRGSGTVCYNVQPLVTGQSYAYAVRVRNAVGLSDPTTISDTTSGNSKSTIVAKNTSLTFGNCKVAMPAPGQTVCVQYTVPSGGGGLAGITGNTFLPTGFCSGGCTGGGVLDTVAPLGFTDVNNPIVETINWDASVSPNGKNSIVYWQAPSFNNNIPGPLPSCLKSQIAKPNPCIRKLVVLQNNSTPNELGDVHAEILFTSDKDALSGKH